MKFVGNLIRRNPVRSGVVLVVIVIAIAAAVIIPLQSQSSNTDVSPAADEPTPSSSSCPARDVVGIAGGAEIMTLPDAVLDHELDAMRAMGATWIRVGVEWNIVESSQGDYDFSVPDRVVDHARARGFQVLGVVLGTPPWARAAGSPNSPHVLPDDPAQFGRFAGDTAAHFGPRIGVWEVWNEPNIVNFAKPRPDVARYHAMLVAASAQIRSRTSPAAQIVTGGLAPAGDDGTNIAPATFVDRLYDFGGQDAWDMIGLHPYTYPVLPDDDASADWNAYQRMELTRNTMKSRGDGAKQIWITEFGAPTGGDPARAVSLGEQAQALVTVLTRAGTDPLLGPVFVHSSRDRGSDAYDIEDHFGVLFQDFSPKPAYTAIQKIAACDRAPQAGSS